MKNIVLAGLFAVLLFLLTACNTESAPINQTPVPLAEEQEFILSPEIKAGSFQAASLSTTTPRLVVRLSIQPELDKQGNPTGKRFGQAAFFWTDRARSKGGSNLGGTVGLLLRDANSSYMDSAVLASSGAPIMSNVDLYKQVGYEDHIVKTAPVSFNGQVCVEVSSLNLLSTNGYFINHQWTVTDDYDTVPLLRLCDRKSTKSGTDLQLRSFKERLFSVMSGTEFPLTMAVINSGSSAAKNVTVTYTIPYAMAISFVEDQSSLFACSSTTTETTEGPAMKVSCYAEKMRVGIQSLPLIFSTTKEAPLVSGLFEFYMNVSTSSTETDMTNNEADSFVLVY